MKLKCTTLVIAALLSAGSVSLAAHPTMVWADENTDALQQRVNDAYIQLQSYTNELELANSSLMSVKQDLANIQGQIDQTKKDIESKKEEISRGQKIIAERSAANYKQGNANLLSVVFGASSFEDMFSRMFYANKVADRDNRVVEQVKNDMAALEKSEEELEQQESLQKQLVADEEQKKSEVQTKLNGQRDFYNGLDAQLKEELAKEEARKKAEEAARKKAEEEAQKLAQQQQQQQQQQHRPQSGGNRPAPAPQPPAPNTNNTNSGNAPAGVVDYALSQVGKPYVYGAGGPDAFDCSGLTSWAYARVGISIPHWAQGQYNLVRSKGHLVYSTSALKPGDLVFWGGPSSIYHVGMYIGGGRYVHASMPGIGVVTQSLSMGGGFAGGGSPV